MPIVKIFIALFCAAWVLSWFRSPAPQVWESVSYSPPNLRMTGEGPYTKADSIVLFARKLIGKPYVYGSTDPKKGFDCSGFAYHVLGTFGVVVPRTSADYASYGKPVAREKWQKGDVILFLGSKDRDRIGHIGIITSEPGEPLRFIHSSSSTKNWGVVETDFTANASYQERFVEIRRLF